VSGMMDENPYRAPQNRPERKKSFPLLDIAFGAPIIVAFVAFLVFIAAPIFYFLFLWIAALLTPK
jgi:hypothetical protein